VALYAQAIPEGGGAVTMAQLRRLLGQAGRYRPPELETGDRLDWIRLIVPLVTRDETLGVWVFGRRDPDDFYPQNDIDLLVALANQIAPVIENIRLYEALQRQAQDLADEVTSRTAELKAERDRTQAVLDSAGEGIFFTDPIGVILYANPRMALTTGYDSQDLVGRSLELWEGDANSPDSYRELWTAIYSGEAWSGDMLLRRRDGHYRDISLTISPIRSEEGTLTGYVGVQSDISKLKEVDRLKSNIISSVSHELKTPLTTIKTYLMLLRRGKLEKQQSYYQVLDRESERLGHIIEDLLDLSALDTGKLPSNLEALDMQEVVNSTVTSCLTIASGKGTHLRAAVDTNGHQMLADRRQLEQVLSNLVVNAVNYSPAGGEVTITATNTVLNDKPAIRVAVADTGPGIPDDELPYLFERFFRGRVARESNSPGTGLGLAICREIIERHGGHITAENRPAGGAVFSICLLAADGGSTADAQQADYLTRAAPDAVEQ
jgi:PAS domain S-box-containing protein